MDFDPKKDYYKILDIPETATAEEAKKAFKKAAVKHHPDRGGDKAKFQEINEAFQTLGDEKKKSQYDAYRKGGYSDWGFWGWQGGFGGFWWFGGGQGGFDVDLGDLLGGMFWGWFGGSRESERDFSGEDIKVGIDITFEESYLGVSKKVAYSRNKKIEGIDEKTCSTCHGSGRTVKRVQTPFGVMQTQAACSACGGVGHTYTKDGKSIHNPFEKIRETIDVKIPEGITDGVYIKFAGKGNDGLNGESGDLYIKISIQASAHYERRGDNLYTKVAVSLFDLVLGGEVMINHPEGKLKVKIPKATQVGDMVKISGKGFGKGGMFGSKGDLYLIPKVEIPKKLTKEQEKLWSELKDIK